MKTKIAQALIGGAIGTAVMTLVMTIATLMGMPRMSPPTMLSVMMGTPIAIGWMIHFMIGMIFSLAYGFFFIEMVRRMGNNILKGAVFGMAAFVFAQIMMAIMGTMFPMVPMEGSMMLMMAGSFVGHVVFGITVALFVKVRI